MAEKEYQHVKHEFAPVYNQESRILILGSLPSVKSRKVHFYYGHPQNRFWKVLAGVCQEEKIPDSIEEKIEFLHRNYIAVWDVIDECDIIGSSDSSIKNVKPVELQELLDQTKIEKIYANGNAAYDLYMKYIYPNTKKEIIKLPSTSPANAAFQLDRLLEVWGSVLHR